MKSRRPLPASYCVQECSNYAQECSSLNNNNNDLTSSDRNNSTGSLENNNNNESDKVPLREGCATSRSADSVADDARRPSRSGHRRSADSVLDANSSRRVSRSSQGHHRKVSLLEEEGGTLAVPLSNSSLDVGHYKGYLKLSLCGFALMALSYALNVINPIEVVKTRLMKMEEGSFAFSLWKNPPVKVYVGVYLFNITNGDRFVSGEDKRLKVQEIGPYVYSEQLENTNVVFNENRTISFMPQRTLVFEPAMSSGDPTKDLVNVVNIPLLGISSMLHNSSMAFNLALSMLVRHLSSQPFKLLPVDDFLWGYDDPLIKLASTFLPSWIPFSKFGLLERILDEGNNTVTMHLPQGADKTSKQSYFIDQFNGLPAIKQWGYDPEEENRTKCNDLQQTLEGVLFPRHLNPSQSFHLYRKAFCRTLPIHFDRAALSDRGIPIYIYKMADNAFDSPDQNADNACYCDQKAKTCLPSGLSDISPCYFRIPVALSRPHFLLSDPKLLEDIEGLNPDEEKHSTHFGIQPDVGVPIYVKTSIQINLVVRKTRFNYKISPFNNKIIPIFWLQVMMPKLPDHVNFLMDLCFIYGPILQTTAISIVFLVGFALLVLATMGYVRVGWLINKTTISSKNNRAVVAGMLKPVTASWSAQAPIKYSQVQIVPMANTRVLERTR